MTMTMMMENLEHLQRQQQDQSPVLFLIFIILSGVRLSPLGTVATLGQLYQPQMIDDGDCGAIDGMKIGRGNRNTWRKPATLSTTNPT
jgi:hypothetical protein